MQSDNSNRKLQKDRAEQFSVDVAADQIIRQAIAEKRLITFIYRGNLRIVEPHDYGLQKGRVRLLCYQTGGQSSRGGLPAWRLVDLDGMTKLRALDERFQGSRGDASQKHYQWDVLFARVTD